MRDKRVRAAQLDRHVPHAVYRAVQALYESVGPMLTSVPHGRSAPAMEHENAVATGDEDVPHRPILQGDFPIPCVRHARWATCPQVGLGSGEHPPDQTDGYVRISWRDEGACRQRI